MWHLAYSFPPEQQAFFVKWARDEEKELESERERMTERAITHIHFFNNLPGELDNRMLKYVRDSINIFAHAPTLSFPGPCVSLLFYLV